MCLLGQAVERLRRRNIDMDNTQKKDVQHKLVQKLSYSAVATLVAGPHDLWQPSNEHVQHL